MKIQAINNNSVTNINNTGNKHSNVNFGWFGGEMSKDVLKSNLSSWQKVKCGIDAYSTVTKELFSFAKNKVCQKSFWFKTK